MQFFGCIFAYSIEAGSKGLEALIDDNDSRGVSGDLVKRIKQVIATLLLAPDAGNIIGPPGWRIHQLTGDRAGTWSISVSGNWRITFAIEEGEIVDLDLEDDH